MHYHLKLDIKGAIKSRDLSWFLDDDGNPVSQSCAMDYLLDMLTEGKLFLPVGDCDNFDHQKGCRGHEKL